MAFDSHAHINSKSCDNVSSIITEINKDSALDRVVNVGLDVDTSKEVIDIAKKNRKFLETVGIHPLYADDVFDIDDIFRLASNASVVGIGEIGLDESKDNYDLQERFFIKQIAIANILKLPVIIHASKNMTKKIISIFECRIRPQYGCVFHSFYPDLEDYKYLLAHGYYISFSGFITKSNAKKSLVLLRQCDKDRFLVETDSPYIGVFPNNSESSKCSDIRTIIQRMGEVLDTSYSDVENMTCKNAESFYLKKRIR